MQLQQSQKNVSSNVTCQSVAFVFNENPENHNWPGLNKGQTQILDLSEKKTNCSYIFMPLMSHVTLSYKTTDFLVLLSIWMDLKIL